MVKVKAVVESGHFRNDRKETGYITFNVKNRPVTKVKDLEDLNMGFGEEQTIDLNTYFNDPVRINLSAILKWTDSRNRSNCWMNRMLCTLKPAQKQVMYRSK